MWFHSATSEIVDKILKEGFRSPVSFSYFNQPLYSEHSSLQEGLVRMLSEQSAASFLEHDFCNPLPQKEYEKLIQIWIDQFYPGTIIWLMPDSPDATYGETHLQVTLPYDATMICQDPYLGTAFFSSENKISSSLFKKA